MKKYAIALLLFLCAAARAGSPLSLQYPFGVPDMALNGPAAAMGGSGTAVAEEYFGMSLNPANIAIGGRSAFSATVSFDFTTVSDADGNSSASGYSPKMISLILPVGIAGNIGFSMQKRYDANINYSAGATIPRADGYGYTRNSIEIQNHGSLTAWQAGWGYRLKNILALGLAYERLIFNKDSRNVFESVFSYDLSDGPLTQRASAMETYEETFAGNGIRFGLQARVHEKVTAAAAAEYVFITDNGKVTREYTRSDASAPITPKTENSFSVRMPPSMNIGLAYRPDERWLIAADAQTTLWERYYDQRGGPDDLRRTYGVSAGGRFIPAINQLTAKYWEKIMYGAGLRYNQMPHEDSFELAASAGLGLPIPGEGGQVDIVLEYGRRTDNRYDKYSENTIKLQLGINGARDWFQQR